MAAGPNAPTCDPNKCGPQLGLPNYVCADGTTAGPTGRCLLDATGNCGWEITTCPSDCYGVCVPNIQTGCKTDTDCPTGQMCDVTCSGWGCSVGGTTTTGTGGTGGTGTGSTTPPDPTTGMGGTSVPPTPPTCACPTSDPSCMCDAAGNCKGQMCTGQCVPAKPTCDPAAVICPAITAIKCPDGTPAQPGSIDPMTCCPTYKCAMCVRSPATTNTSSGVACAAPACKCAKQTGTDATTCCPIYECGMADANGACL
jgi:hypothetical protein